MLEIKVYKDNRVQGTLELDPDAQLTMEETSPLFDEQLQNGAFSEPFDTPWSDNNRRVLGAPEMLETDNRAGLPYWQIDARGDGVPFITRGKATLLEHSGSFDYRRGKYTLSLAGPESLFGTLIGGKKLNQLQLGGNISTGSNDMRSFAYQVMLGNIPQYPYIAFAPIFWPDFIDTAREDYNNENIANDTVNNIIINPGAFSGVGWKFGRPNLTTPTTPVASGAANYEDYRTVPFFQLTYVLKRCFTEFGYTVYGDILNDADFNKVYIANNFATEIYNSIHQDINRFIYPGNHMPDMTIGEFLAAVGTAFRFAPIFFPGNKVMLLQHDAPMRAKATIDLTTRTLSTYKATRTEAGLNGVTTKWGWDSADGMVSERVKDIDVKRVVNQGNDLADAVAGAAGSVEGDLVYVINENYYYQRNSAGAFVFYSEGQQEVKVGDGQKSIEPKISPLCHLIKYPTDNGQISDICGIRMGGSYVNSLSKQIINPMGLRICYIDKFNGASGSAQGLPISFTHALETSNGVTRTAVGLNLAAPTGLYAKYHKKWIDAQVAGWSVTANLKMRADETELLPFNKKVQIGSVQYMVQRLKKNVGANLQQVEALLMVV